MGTPNDDYTVTAYGSASNHPFNTRIADYDVLNNDRTHVLVVNYVYNTPKFIKSDAPFAKIGKVIANDWQVSGITAVQSGAPNNITFGISGLGNLNERFTGSPDVQPRIVYKGPVSYPKGQYNWIDASVLGLPPVKGSQGFDSSRYPVRDPGFQNWDISILKNIPLHGESMRLQLRGEMFNAWNHPEFNGWNRSATFNQAGQLINLPNALGGNGGRFGFGALTGTMDPRRIQLAAKLYF